MSIEDIGLTLSLVLIMRTNVVVSLSISHIWLLPAVLYYASNCMLMQGQAVYQ